MPKMKWTSDTEAARIVCEELGYLFEAQFIEVAVAKSQHIVVRYTCAKPEEARELKDRVERRGWSSSYCNPLKPTSHRQITAEDIANDAIEYSMWEIHAGLGGRETWPEYVQTAVDRLNAEARRRNEIDDLIRLAAMDGAAGASTQSGQRQAIA